ncbi:MAG: hypothetical protein U9Q67_01615, partial [Patescibacteria group bacterium]|nr:hypothetical protein [Patescibacteria group bacterium]
GRRRFLTLVASAVGGGLLFDELLRHLRIHYIRGQRGIAEADGSSMPQVLSPGFIERNIQADFFTLQNGHGPWLKEAVAHPVVNEVCCSLITEMDSLPEGYLSVGHAFALACNTSASLLVNRYPSASKELLFSEIIHVAVIAAAAVFSHFIDYAYFGFDTRKWGGSEDLFIQRWGITGIGKKYPRLLPALNSLAVIETQGKDRTMHLFSHLLIAYQILYSKRNGGVEHLTTPLIMNLLSDYLTTFAPNEAVSAFGRVAGYGHEASTTQLCHIGARITGQSVEEGFPDREVRHDLAANELGLRIGLLLADNQLGRAAAIMYDPRLRRDTIDPFGVVENVLGSH